MKQEYLRPHDVCVLLQLALGPWASFRELSQKVGLSLGETHNSAKRLELARLVTLDEPSVNFKGSREFLFFGVPYVFPARLGPVTRGVPTGIGAVSTDAFEPSDETVVWPSPRGRSRGSSISPLCPSLTDLWEENEELYRLMTLVDALRIGRARERKMARDQLSEALR